VALADRVPADRDESESVRAPLSQPGAWEIIDRWLAALCLEHGLEIVSADSDFARFTEISWINPVA
jgi:predicted nucleic acid-binding protein